MPRFYQRKRTSRYSPYARSGVGTKRRKTMSYGKTKSLGRRPTRTKFARKVMSVVNRSAETKVQFISHTLNGTIPHNKLTLLSDNALRTSTGLRGESQTATLGGGSRVGKKVYAKGISCSMMIEQSQKRALCHYWLYLVRNRTNPDTQITAKNQMFEGISPIIPMDYIDTDLVDIMYSKKIRISMPNQATAKDMVSGSGLANVAEPDNLYKGVVTNPQKIQKFYVPLNKTLTFRDVDPTAGNQNIPVPNQRYQWVLTGYDNASTSDDTDIGKITFATKLKFTDV